ncbi:DUF397 domain-containing protein [Nocardia sp. NPDC005978]|uniref:DUF397 domain-containing protein n=1 Tax=Nocardia sp. NPDC005978 TaxID=3156725 RepID=UPI0033A736F0
MYNLSGIDPAVQGADFVKSSASGGNANCVEVAKLPGGDVAVRHSKVPGGHVIVYSPSEWAAFTAGVRAGEFD